MEQGGCCRGGGDAHGHPHKYRPQAAQHYVPYHIASRRAQRHADSDLTRAAGNVVGGHTVESDRRQRQRQQAEQLRQAGDQLMRAIARLLIEIQKLSGSQSDRD